MKIYQERNACDFEEQTWNCENFWKIIHDNGLESALNDFFDDCYPDGLELTAFNDILRFDGDTILQDLGYVENEN